MPICRRQKLRYRAELSLKTSIGTELNCKTLWGVDHTWLGSRAATTQKKSSYAFDPVFCDLVVLGRTSARGAPAQAKIKPELRIYRQHWYEYRIMGATLGRCNSLITEKID
jgi:hypothetical protein